MPAPKVSEEEFIALCREHHGSMSLVAEELGQSLRSANARAAAIEERTGLKLRFGNHSRDFADLVRDQGYEPAQARYGWFKTDDASVFIANPEYGKLQYDKALERALTRIEKRAPKYPKIKRDRPKQDGCQLILNLTDWHFGAWGLGEAHECANDTVSMALQRSQPFNLERIVLTVGNDLLHVDNTHYTTTNGTPQQMDGSTWYEAYDAAVECYSGLIERLTQVAKTEVILCSGNHDKLSSYTLAQLLRAAYRHMDIDWQVSAKKRKYSLFGNTFNAFTHGDKVKEVNLALVVPDEAADLWGPNQFRYVYLGHEHHRHTTKYEVSKEHPGFEFHWLTSPKPGDDWNDLMAHGAKRGANVFVSSKTGGMEAQFNLNL